MNPTPRWFGSADHFGLLSSCTCSSLLWERLYDNTHRFVVIWEKVLSIKVWQVERCEWMPTALRPSRQRPSPSPAKPNPQNLHFRVQLGPSAQELIKNKRVPPHQADQVLGRFSGLRSGTVAHRSSCASQAAQEAPEGASLPSS